MTQALRSLLDFCFPGSCAACGEPCAGHQPFCPSCDARMRELQERPACARCGAPLTRDHAPCPHCRGQGLSPLAGVARLSVFSDPLRRAIHYMKYRRNWPLAEPLADRVWAHPAIRDVLSEADVLVSVPLHRLRQIARGYNQADVVARRLAKHSGLRVSRALVRIRPTASQTVMTSATRRAENMRGAFAQRRASGIAGQRVVLIDDVMTSGATLRAAARALQEGKPKSVCAVVLAVADPKGQAFQAV